MTAYVRRAGAPIGAFSPAIVTLVCFTAAQERRARRARERERASRALEVRDEVPNRMSGRGNRACSISFRTRGIHVL
jgi:hypothetical protein